MKYYAAYGSNLNVQQMGVRCPNAKPVARGYIKGYKLVFRYYASIEPSDGDQVPVGIWAIDEEDEKSLDRYEGYPSLYRKEYLDVLVEGEISQEMSVMVYIMNENTRGYGKPSLFYLSTVAEGYDDVGLDLSYLERALV